MAKFGIFLRVALPLLIIQSNVLPDEIPPFNKDPSICHHKESREFFPYSKCPGEMLEKCDGCRANCKCEGTELQCTFEISPLAMKHCKPNTTQGGGNECEFSSDCPFIPNSVWKVNQPCNHGKCDERGDILKMEHKCDYHTDCPCRSNPKKCFCILGKCFNRRWECHQGSIGLKECKKMKKCKGKQCICQWGTCEIDRSSVACEFSSDCPPRGFQPDKCNHGKCIFQTDALIGECSKYTDCPCRSNPKECFCIKGACTNQRWECHNSKDCKEMKKCKGKRCFCRGNTCEILQDSCKTIKDCRNDCLFDKNWKERCLCEKGKCIYEE